MRPVLAGSREPVSWTAHLARSPSASYTEIDDVPVLIDRRDGQVQPLTPAWASIWAQLDGRPIAEVLQVDPVDMSWVEARNLIEVLRRLKARELIVDAESLELHTADSPFDVAPSLTSFNVSLSGTIRLDGAIDTLTIDPFTREHVTVRISERDGNMHVTFRRRLRRRVFKRVDVATNESDLNGDGAVEVLGIIVASLESREVLKTPGVADLLAGFAEHVAAHGSLHQ